MDRVRALNPELNKKPKKKRPRIAPKGENDKRWREALEHQEELPF